MNLPKLLQTFSKFERAYRPSRNPERTYRPSVFLVLIILISLAAISSLWAGGRWEFLGPEGGEVRVLIRDPANPEIVFAGSASNGIFKSFDGGRNWQPVSASGIGTSIRHLLIDPEDSQRLFGVSFSLFRSSDGARTWQRVGTGLAGLIHEILFDPEDRSVLFAATSGGLYKSVDDGESFSKIDNQLSGAIVNAIAFDPEDPSILFAARTACSVGLTCGLFRSSNKGESFTLIDDEISLAEDILVSSQNPDIVLASENIGCSIDAGTDNCGIYRSIDGGDSWMEISPQINDVDRLFEDPSSPNTIYALGNSLYSSSDLGATWSEMEVSPGISEFSTISPHPEKPDEKLLGTASPGLFLSEDGGSNWEPVNSGYRASGLAALAVNPIDADWLYASTIHGLWRSSDSGQHWQFSPLQYLSCLRTDPQTSDVLYGCAGDIDQVLKSTNNGEAWTPMNSGLPYARTEDIAINPANTNQLFAALAGDEFFPGGIYRSQDGGAHWTKKSNGLDDPYVTSVEINPGNPNIVYAGSLTQGFYRSSNGGESWTLRSSGLPSDAGIVSLRIDPHQDETLYATLFTPDLIFFRGLFRTTNGGSSWEEAIVDGSAGGSVFPDPLHEGVLYGTNPLLKRTRDGGQSWIVLDSGLGSAGVSDLLFSPAEPDLVWLHSRNGVFRFPGSFWLFQAGNSGGTRFDGVAVSNFTPEPAQLKLEEFTETAAEPSGPDTTAVSFELGAKQQVARLRGQFFPDRLTQPAWLRLTSDTPVAGFFQFGTPALSALDGGVSIADPSRLLVLPRVVSGPSSFHGTSASTQISVLNPTQEPQEVHFSYFPAGGAGSGGLQQVRTIGPLQLLSLRASEFFQSENLDGYVRIEVEEGRGVMAFALIELPEADTLLGFNGLPWNSNNRLFSAQLATTSGLFTEVSLVNLAPVSRVVQLKAVSSEGASLGEPVDVVLEPGAEALRDAATLFASAAGQGSAGGDFEGSLIVEADGEGVTGGVVFGDPRTARFAAALPLQTSPFVEAVYSQVANITDFFTGLAFFYPSDELSASGDGAASATIQLEVYRPDGTLVGESEFELSPGARTASLVPQLVPESAGQAGGYIHVHSTHPIISQMILGALDNLGIRQFSAVPPAVD